MLILLLMARTYGSGNELFDGTIIQSPQSVVVVEEGDAEGDVDGDVVRTLWITTVCTTIRKMSTMMFDRQV